VTSELKRILRKHFRIFSLLMLSTIILALSLSLVQEDSTVHFMTYGFGILGEGEIGDVDIDFDYSSEHYVLSTYLPAGEYEIRSTRKYELTAEGNTYCQDSDEVDPCMLSLAAPSAVRVLFKDKMVPNGHFSFSFFNKTNIVLEMNLGKNYSFDAIESVYPRGFHGQYAPDTNEVVLNTDIMIEEGIASYLDFDLYTTDAIKEKSNESKEWIEDFILVPLVVAFVMLLVSDIIDYLHKYVKSRKD